MKLTELFEELSQIQDDIKDILMDYFISLKIKGVQEVPVAQVLEEVQDEFDLAINFDVLSKFFEEVPLIANMNAETIYFSEKKELPVDNNDSEEIVSDLADETRNDIALNSNQSKVADLAMKAVN